MNEKKEKLFVKCACGCGTQINKYDSRGRIKRYVSGHGNYRKNFKKEGTIRLYHKLKSSNKVAKMLGCAPSVLRAYLSRWKEPLIYQYSKGLTPWNKGKKCPSISVSAKNREMLIALCNKIRELEKEEQV